MKIIIISQHFPPEPGSAAIRMYELAEYLVKNGHKVTVITPFPNYPQGIIYKKYRGKFYMKERLGNLTIIRTFVYASPKRREFIHGLLYYLSFALTSIFGAFTILKHELIYVYSPPYFLGLSAYIIGKIFNIPYVLEINDLWPKSAIDMGIIKNRLIIKLARKIEKFIYQKAKKIFVYSNRMRQEIIKTGITEGKIEIHPLWIDTNSFKPDKTSYNSIREQYGLSEKFIVMYAGNMGVAQGLHYVIECAKILRKIDKIFFVLIGEGIEKAKLVHQTKRYRLKNILFIPQQPIEIIPRFLSAADVLLVHLNKAPSRLGTIPAKILSYMSCGRPIISGVEGETADLITKSNCGINIEPQNPEAMARAIMYLYNNQHLRAQLGENARNYAIKYFDKNKLLKNLENCLEEIIKSNKINK